MLDSKPGSSNNKEMALKLRSFQNFSLLIGSPPFTESHVELLSTQVKELCSRKRSFVVDLGTVSLGGETKKKLTALFVEAKKKRANFFVASSSLEYSATKDVYQALDRILVPEAREVKELLQVEKEMSDLAEEEQLLDLRCSEALKACLADTEREGEQITMNAKELKEVVAFVSDYVETNGQITQHFAHALEFIRTGLEEITGEADRNLIAQIPKEENEVIRFLKEEKGF